MVKFLLFEITTVLLDDGHETPAVLVDPALDADDSVLPGLTLKS